MALQPLFGSCIRFGINDLFRRQLFPERHAFLRAERPTTRHLCLPLRCSCFYPVISPNSKEKTFVKREKLNHRIHPIGMCRPVEICISHHLCIPKR